MEPIKIKVKSKQLDGSTEVADTTLNGSNQFSSENSVIPSSGGGGGSSFLGTLSEDNLLFEIDLNDFSCISHAPEGFTSNHLVAVVLHGTHLGDNSDDVDTCALGFLSQYNTEDGSFKVNTSIGVALSGEDRACGATIYEFNYGVPTWAEEGSSPVAWPTVCFPDGYVRNHWGDYDNNNWETCKIYLLK